MPTPKISAIILLFALTNGPFTRGDDNFNTQLEQASKKLGPVMPVCEELMNAGDFAAANAKLLDTYPETTRTPAESFLLANIFFESDRKLSYKLHQAAAKAEPKNPDVIWEWGMEQHRAGDYAGALATYQEYAKAKPRVAMSYALEADCLLRLNRIDDAVDAWKKSEEGSGSVEQMENLVCAVHRDPAPHERRAQLLAKATKQHDVEAAQDLIALDCDFPKDWWNGGPQEHYLKHDLPAVIAALKLPADDVRVRAIKCAAECASDDRSNQDAVTRILHNYRFVIDTDHSLPAHIGLLSIIVAAADETKLLEPAALRKQIFDKALAMARKSKDAQLWNVAVILQPHDSPDEELKLEREGWQATGDPRFAAGVLLLKMTAQKSPLKSDDPELAAALKQHSESGMIQRAVILSAASEGKLTKQQLAAGAQAEFNHFSAFTAPATVIIRPRSGYLRQYFGQMHRLATEKKPPAKP